MLAMGQQAGEDDPRWEYKVIWRYGPLLLVVVGLGMIVAVRLDCQRPRSA